MSNRDKNELTATTQDDLARKDAIARVLGLSQQRYVMRHRIMPAL